MDKNTDPFAWRKQGKKFEIGDEKDQGISAMLSIDDSLIIITKKSIHEIKLADSVDPNRINPQIPDSQQCILSFGSDDALVGRTLLQAKVLFENHCLPQNINCSKVLSTAMSFLKKVASLYELEAEYRKVENEKNTLFEGKTEDDYSLHLPSVSDVEQRTKQFIINTDHSIRHMMELAQNFYPKITNEKWNVQLHKQLKQEQGAGHPSVEFIESINSWIWLMRNLRNAIEHPKINNEILIQNYRLIETGNVKPPMISYVNNDTPLPEMPVSKLMTSNIENLLLCFELLMAHLCNIHVKPFAGDIRSVIEVPLENKTTQKTHVRFGYHIAWTK